MNKTKIISAITIAMLLSGTSAFAATNPSSNNTTNTDINTTVQDNTPEGKKDFKNMNLADKRKAIVDKFTNKANDAVKAGTISQADASKFLTELKIAVEKWNGTGPVGIEPPSALCRHHIDDLNSLTPEQKKEKLLTNFTVKINRRVSSGKITQAEGDKLLSDLKTSIANWDGKDTRTLNLPNGLFHKTENSDSKDTTTPNDLP